VNFIQSKSEEELITSTICEAEISEGIYREEGKRFGPKLVQKEEIFASFSEVVPFDSIQADFAGRIRANLSQRGEMIDDLDVLIAAAAMDRSAILVTRNIKHFKRIPGLQVMEI